MGKQKKKTALGMFNPMQISSAESIARDPGSFRGTGIRRRVIKAQSKVRELVNQGYRLNPKAKTSQTYKDAVKKANSPAGRLGKLLVR